MTAAVSIQSLMGLGVSPTLANQWVNGAPAPAIDMTLGVVTATSFEGATGAVTPAAGSFTSIAASGNATISGYVLRSVAAAQTAAGTTRADALAITKEVTQITTAASGTGAVLPTGVVGMRLTVFNAGANAIQIYGAGSSTIDGTAGATGVPLTNAKRAEFFYVAANTWISAQLGVVSA